MSYFSQQFVSRPIFDIPFKTEWRKSVEARFGEPVTRMAPENPVENPPAKKRVRTKSYRKTVERKDCGNACGKKLIATNNLGICYECYIKARHRLQKTCAQCPNPVNRNNKSPLCAECYRVKIYTRGRLNCEHPGCLEKINRSTNPKRINLCGWHHPESRTRSEYKSTSPKMEAAA